MNRSQLKLWAFTAVVLLLAGQAFAESPKTPTEPLAVNQTEGFAGGQVVAFTYFESFDCLAGSFDDVDQDGQPAAVQPSEFNPGVATVGPLTGQPFSHCILGFSPALDPAGGPSSGTEELFVLVPFFDTNPSNNEAFTPQLQAFLISTFGFVPEAFKKHPDVAVQCPEPGPPHTQHTGAPGTCTTHTTTLDFGRILDKALGLPNGTPVPLPTANHSHVIDKGKESARWWKIISVLVTDPAAWPNVDGTTGITSVDALRAAQAAGQAKPDVDTNFFLFFNSLPF
jgi:hypothetical protein